MAPPDRNASLQDTTELIMREGKGGGSRDARELSEWEESRLGNEVRAVT